MDHKPITIDDIFFTIIMELIVFVGVLGLAYLEIGRSQSVMGKPQEQSVPENREENKQEIVINYSGPRLRSWARDQIVQCFGDLGTNSNVHINYIEN